MRPLLLPGTHLLRRRPHGFQAGLDPATGTVVCPDTDWAADPRRVAALVGAGLALEDDHVARSALPPAHADPWQRHAAAAAVRRTASALPRAQASRSQHVVRVARFGHPLSDALAADLVELCRRSGLAMPGRRRPGPPPRGVVPPTAVHVMVGLGEPPRELLDGHRRDGAPHLVVSFVEGRAVVGPFVVPGETACLRCIDAYRTDEDPSWPLLVEQYSHAASRDRPDGMPEPLDPALAAVALGWAARDLTSYVEGGTPTTLSATLTLHPALEEIGTVQWPPHPHCGCGWR